MRRRDNTTLPVGIETVTAEHLEAELQQARQVAAVRRGHELQCRTAEAEHGRNLADVDEGARRAERDRTMREGDATADADLAVELRQLRSAGVRIKARSDMARSAEYRAHRLEQLRTLNLKVLVPVLLGFAAWSTTGVHDGATRLMAATSHSNPMWWALWLLEPVLIGAVVWITIVRARLASAGGKIATRAVQVGVACLSVSVFLNLVDGVPHGPADKWMNSWPAWVAMFAAMIAHIVGPVGAAATAHLIGLVDDSIAETDPWTGKDGQPVPLLADMDLRLSTAVVAKPAGETSEAATRVAPEGDLSSEALWAEMDELEEEPPEADGPEPPRRDPDDDGSEGAAKRLPRSAVPPVSGSHISDTGRSHNSETERSHNRGDQGTRDETAGLISGATRKVTPRQKVSPRRRSQVSQQGGETLPAHVEAAVEVNTARGDETAQRIRDYETTHPGATVKQICADLEVSKATVMRARKKLKQQEV